MYSSRDRCFTFRREYSPLYIHELCAESDSAAALSGPDVNDRIQNWPRQAEPRPRSSSRRDRLVGLAQGYGEHRL